MYQVILPILFCYGSLPAQTYQFVPQVTPITQQNGSFILEVDLTPSTVNEIDTMVGFSGSASPGQFADLAGYVVLFTDNNITDAVIMVGGNPGNAQPNNSVQVVAGQTYGIIFEVDVASKTYTAKVRMPNGSIVLLAEDYGFRQQASSVVSFVYLPYVVQEYAGVATMDNLQVTQVSSDPAQLYEEWTAETDGIGTKANGTTLQTYKVTLGSCGQVAVVNSPTREGNRALRHQVDCTSPKRAEISDANWNSPIDKPFWYGWSLHPEGDWGNTVQYVGQWRISNVNDAGFPNRRCVTNSTCGDQGQQSGSGWHLQIDNRRWKLTIARQLLGCDDCAGTDYVDFDLGPVAFNQWTDFVMNVKYSGSEDGYCTVWKQVNGGGYELVCDFFGRTWYNFFQDGSSKEGQPTNAANMTVGLYYGSNANQRVMYSDEIRQARGPDGGFDLVRPDQGGAPVGDTEAPVIANCPADISVDINPGDPDPAVSWTAPTATDNVGVTSLTSSHSPGDTFPVGATVVTYTAADAAGNSTSCSFTVTVSDTACGAPQDWSTVGAFTPLVGTVRATFTATPSGSSMDGLVGLASGNATAYNELSAVVRFYADGTIEAYQGNGIGGGAYVDAPGGDLAYQAGVGYQVEIIADTVNNTYDVSIDGINYWSGLPFRLNQSQLDSIIRKTLACTLDLSNLVFELSDSQAPVFSGCPGNISVNTTTGISTGTASWVPPTATDNVGVTSTSSSHSPGDTFPLGVTTVAYTAEDAAGNTATCTFTVTVVDTEAPVLSGCPSDMIVDIGEGEPDPAVSWTAPTAADNVGVTALTSTHSPGDIFPVGVTTVVYTASDAAGSQATCSFTVTVTEISCGNPQDWATLGSYPAAGGLLVASCSATPGGPAIDGLVGLSLGEATAYSDLSTVVRFYTDGTIEAYQGNGSGGGTYVDAQGGDLYYQPGTTYVIEFLIDTTSNSYDVSVDGITRWTGLPFRLNQNQLDRFVRKTVICSLPVDNLSFQQVDTEAPVISGCPGDITVEIITGDPDPSVDWTTPTASDNSGQVTLTSNYSGGMTFPVGSTTVVYTATDTSGNVSSCSFVVTVVEVLPVWSLLDDDFSDGNRSNQALPDSAAWWNSVQTGSGLALVSSEQLSWNPQSKNNQLVTYFTDTGLVDLAEGERLVVEFDLELPSTFTNTVSELRMGLFDSGGSRVGDNATHPTHSVYSQSLGYLVRIRPLNGTFEVRERTQGVNGVLTSLSGASLLAPAQSNTPVLVTGVTYRVSFVLERLPSNALEATFSISGTGLTGYQYVESDSSGRFGFDMFGLACITPPDGTFLIDNVLVEVQVD